MPTIFIFHGVVQGPQANWFPWLKEELEKMGHEVIVPKFPTPINQKLQNWLKVLEKHRDKLDGDTILVGHSLGVSFALNVIERQPVKAAFLAAGFTGKLGHFFDGFMKTFTQKDFDWERIRRNCPRFFAFHADNDPLVPLTKGEELATKLGTELIMVPEGGHLTGLTGFVAFPQLLEKIRTVL